MKQKYSLPVLIVAGLIGIVLNLFDSDSSVTRSNQTKVNSKYSIENYTDARSIFWGKLYSDGGKTLYCGAPFGRNFNPDLNIEHIYPMSWVTNSLNCGDRNQCRKNDSLFNQIEADLHNLFPTKKEINALRSSYAFSLIPGEKRIIENCDFEIDKNKHLIEPRENVRGDIARAMLYMEDRYSLTIFKKQKKLLQQWNQLDPVDDAEKKRNLLIESIQGNKNPFIQ